VTPNVMELGERRVMSSRNRFARALVAALPLVAALGGVASAQKDTVNLKDGKTQEVQVASADFDGLYYLIKSAQSKFRWTEISSVRYGGASEYYRAMDSMSAGKLADAETSLDKLAGDAKLRPVIRQEVLFAQGLCARRLGKVDKAVGAWRELLKGFPKSRYLLSAGSNLLSALLSTGDVAGAQKSLDDLLAASKSAGLSGADLNSFGLLRARILFEQKKYSEAQNAFSSVGAAPGEAPDVVQSAKLGVAYCNQMLGKAADAERDYRTLSTADAGNAVLSGAWNGLGDLALVQGSEKRDPDRLRDALFCYLRGVVLYGPTQEETTDEYERALAGSAAAFKAISEVESDAERKKLFLARAKESRTRLETQFPTSRWLNAPIAKPK
jgi:predicted Zn-dependent protease